MVSLLFEEEEGRGRRGRREAGLKIKIAKSNNVKITQKKEDRQKN